MYPSPSVIIFTTCSGLGFGLLAWLGIGLPDVTGWVAFAFFAVAYLLAVGGLLASTFHLGHPERAMKAFSQWRSSWLSREGVAAVAALLVMGVYAAALIFFGARIPVLGWIGAVLSLFTVYATSMIYAQLKTVPRWNSFLTAALLLSISVAGGSLLAGQISFAQILLPIAAIIQLIWWTRGDVALMQSGTDMASATGLGTIGKVRAFEPPHTGTNYLLNELVYQVGRKHAVKLRIIAFALGYAVPVILIFLPFYHALAAMAVLCHLAGIAVSRWLFFAEAEHVVGLYYGKR